MNKAMTETSPLFYGIISGPRRRSHDEVADRAERIASGLQRLGIGQGDSVCMLMRNDIAFIEAAYAAMRLGAYGVPVNWHFKPEEINYVLEDSGTRVLIAHADMLHQLRDAIPQGVTALSVPTPLEILANYKINPDHVSTPDFAIDFESWLTQFPRYDGPAVPQPQNMIYTSGTTGHPKGVRRNAPTPEQTANAERMRGMIYAALSLRAEFLWPARRTSRRPAGADAAVRCGRIFAADRAREDRHHLHGADHVHTPDEAAGRGAQEV
jgi:long-chain acyl-CoA synthetase